MIGLGVMGSNLLLNMADHQFAAIGYDLKPERGAALEAAATPGTKIKGVADLAHLMLALKKPRKIMMLVPAGAPVDAVISNLLPLLEKGDILIDGGNSYFKDTLHRVAYLQDKGIHFMGMGVSGGEMGARTGPSMMPGGDRAAYQYLQPILEAIAAKTESGQPCVAFMGKGAAGHYVKMVHNGIEYAMMQLIAEVYDVLKRGAGCTNEELFTIFDTWNKGPLQSFLMEVTAEVFKVKDDDSEQYLVDLILDQAGSKGTGKWTSQEAMNLPVPIPTIDMAVALRNLSVYKDQRSKAAPLYQPSQPVKAPREVLVADLESALLFGYLMAYSQGLSMLASASAVHEMDIPMPDVIRVWKSGCIIRSALLRTFEAAYKKDPLLPNLLLDKDVAALVQERSQSMRTVITTAVSSGIPVPALMSALGYFDAYRSERLPTNLIQAQRDYFGAHTYQRTDKTGVFHTEWHSGE